MIVVKNSSFNMHNLQIKEACPVVKDFVFNFMMQISKFLKLRTFSLKSCKSYLFLSQNRIYNFNTYVT